VDDAEMGITHVIRGEDLLDTTHRVLALRASLGLGDPPRFGHLPLIVGEDRAKLSKRHGAVALEDFRDGGYLAPALLNYLALLGWAPTDGREILAAAEIVAEFDLDRVTHSAAFFDYKKLDWMNGEYIRALPLAELADLVETQLAARFGAVDRTTVHEVARIGQERATTINALVDQAEFLFVPREDFVVDAEEWAKVVAKTERPADVLDATIAHLETCEWTHDAIDVRPALSAVGFEKVGKVMRLLYLAVEGRAAGLPLFESVQLLGREESLRRLRSARDRVGSAGADPAR
jgi:glutamyl-tRNA synthetase